MRVQGSDLDGGEQEEHVLDLALDEAVLVEGLLSAPAGLDEVLFRDDEPQLLFDLAQPALDALAGGVVAGRAHVPQAWPGVLDLRAALQDEVWRVRRRRHHDPAMKGAVPVTVAVDLAARLGGAQG